MTEMEKKLMKKKLFLRKTSGLLWIGIVFFLFLLPGRTLRAQVTIGEDKMPESYSLLEISTAIAKGGLRLPQLDDAQKTALTTTLMGGGNPTKGLTIYNTTKRCVEYWTGPTNQWISLCDGTGKSTDCSMAFTPAAAEVGSGGGSSPGISVDAPCCDQSGNYVFELVFGETYSHFGDTNLSTTGANPFTVVFDPNDATEDRVAIVRATDPCNNSALYVIGQKGQSGCVQPNSVTIFPFSRVVSVNEPFVLTAIIAGGLPPYTYQWYRTNLTNGSLLGIQDTTNSTTIKEPRLESIPGTYLYTIYVWSPGCLQPALGMAMVTVNPACGKPSTVKITPPSYSNITAGSSISFSVETEGGEEPYTFGWERKKGTGAWTAITADNQIDRIFTFTVLNDPDTYYYHVKVASQLCPGESTTSNDATVTVVSSCLPPSSVTINLLTPNPAPPGSLISLEVSNITGGQAPYTYKWEQRKGTSGPWTPVGSPTGTTTFTAPTDADTYYYHVVVASQQCSGSSTISNEEALTIESAQTCKKPDKVEITPSSVTTAPSSQFTLRVDIEGGENPYTYTWYREQQGSSATQVFPNPNGMLSTFTAPTDAGTYYYYVEVASSQCIGEGSAKSNKSAVTVVPSCGPPTGATITLMSSGTTAPGGSIVLSVSNVTGGQAPYTYNWYQRKGTSALWTAIGSSTGTTFTLTAPSTPDTYYYYVKVSSSQCIGNGNATSNTLPVAVASGSTSGCGAHTVNGGWLEFMCHNLGANENLDPFTPDTGLYGDLYQWGRKADGHEKRNSPVSNTQSPSIVPVDNKFIVNHSGDVSDWLSNSNGQSRWGDGTQNVNPAKGTNDPCPPGWKVPSIAQWASIFKGLPGGTPTTASNGASSESLADKWVWTGSGYKVGSSLSLPAAGLRRRYPISGGTTTIITDVGTGGHYWSSTVRGSGLSHKLIITNTRVLPATDNGGYGSDRTLGGSIRCVKE